MTEFENVWCVGMHFRGPAEKEAASLLAPTSPIRLVREPDNGHDSYAIKIMLEDLHLGYVERAQAAWISPLIDEGQVATAIFDRHEQKGRNLHPILTIQLNDPS